MTIGYKKLALALLSAFVAGTVLVYVYAFLFAQKQVGSSNAFATLMSSNAQFAQGEAQLDKGDVAAAVTSFKNALPSASNAREEAQIKNKLATAEWMSGDYSSAILLSKEVAANYSYSSMARAYAVQTMGQLYYVSSAATRTRITEEIFKDDPYKSFASTTDPGVSYRNLFDYAASLYPLAYAELSSANWYAGTVADIKKKETIKAVDAEKIRTYLSIIEGKVSLADADMRRIRSSRVEQVFLPASYVRKAVVLALLTIAGESYPGMPTPESVLEEALRYAQGINAANSEADITYNYAYLVALVYGKAQANKVGSLISNLYGDGRLAGTRVTQAFNYPNNNSANINANIQLIASVDPKFKDFLISKGWIF